MPASVGEKWSVEFCRGPRPNQVHHHVAADFDSAVAWAKELDESFSDRKSYVGLESMKKYFTYENFESGNVQYGSDYYWVEFRQVKENKDA